jgi:N-acetylglutamate synthase and related acetyltransferases
MILREALKNDLKGILELYKQLNSEDPILSDKIAENIWNEIFDCKYLKYFVAIENEMIVSTCCISIIPNLSRNGRSYGVIENVITHEEYRNLGIGKKIMMNAVEYAKKHNCYKIVLLSSTTRKEAHAFYEKIGFDGNSKKGFEIRFD